jgi:hypothetical protein
MSICRGLAILGLMACATPSPPPAADAPAPSTAAAPAPPAKEVAADNQRGNSPPADAAAPVEAPKSEPPKVKLVTIGMHVAGGPFDEVTKEPFKKAVEPHFPEFKECWAKHVTSHPKQLDVGVDLLIEANGGHPKTSNPRTTGIDKSEAAALMPCIIAVFESVEFPKLDRGRTGVSYSLRFTP